MPVGAVLAAVKVLGLDDLVDGFALANGVERFKFGGVFSVNLRHGDGADGDGRAAVAGNRVLIEE